MKALREKASKKAKINVKDAKHFKILKKSLDARDKSNIHYTYSVEISTKQVIPQPFFTPKINRPKERVAIIGSGPCGLFSALYLARLGFCPIVIERGESVENRKKTIDRFVLSRSLNVSSNVQFGEGGAGAFSDGKLNTGVRSEFKEFVLKEFVSHGAPSEILYLNKPHIGSDKLPVTVKNIREEIISLKGEFLFNTLFMGLNAEDGRIKSITCKDLVTKEIKEINVSEVVLAIGHSARDTYIMLNDHKVEMEKKDMAIGFRIEHKQSMINKSQYGGKFYQHERLKPADYKLVSSVSDVGVFTFCMCPGGVVMPATSEEGMVVTNGMSNYARDGENANSAIIAQVKRERYNGGVLSGIEFLRELERKAFVAGGSDYSAPYQLVGDFLNERVSKGFGEVKPTYPLGVKSYPLHTLLPSDLTKAIQNGIRDMDKRLHGFAKADAVLTGVETRTSSPVRIMRNENLQSPTFNNLYPVGETGHAGGIMSAAIDGVKVASKITEKYTVK